MGNITVNELAKKLKVSSKLIGSLLTVLEIPDVTNETMIEYSVEKAVSDVIMREKAKKSARKAEKEAQAEIAKGNDKQEAVLPKALDNEAPVLHVPSDTKSVESVENVKMEPVIASKEPRISPPMQVEGQNAASNQRPPYTPRPQGDAQRPPYTPRPQGDAQRPPYTCLLYTSDAADE